MHAPFIAQRICLARVPAHLVKSCAGGERRRRDVISNAFLCLAMSAVARAGLQLELHGARSASGAVQLRQHGADISDTEANC